MPYRGRPLRSDPRNVAMPNFASNGYAPSRARKRRQLQISNDEAIQLLQNEWTERQNLRIQLWLEQNPEHNSVPPEPVNILPNENPPPVPQEAIQAQNALRVIVDNIQQNIVRDEQLEHRDNPNRIEPENFTINPAASSHPQTTITPPLQQHPIEQQLRQLVENLQRNPTSINNDHQIPQEDADQSQMFNSNSDANPANQNLLSKIKLGRTVHEVMQDFHLLPLPVLEELRHMRHVKLWFFTNDGLERTRIAKEKTGRYNTARVTFDYERQELVAQNEYEASMKNAPEDNTLTPDQLNQAYPRFIDSIKHANWPAEVIKMFENFFDSVQRHYESRAKPLGRFYTIAQAVYELRNKFHAHVKHHREALILTLDPTDLDRIREQLKASRDDNNLLVDAYRSSQREVSS